MATTTASFSLASSDIASSPVSVSATSTLYKAGLATGVDQMQGMSRRILTSAETYKTMLIPSQITGVFTDATCDYDNDATITHDANSKIVAGIPVYGVGIPAGAYISSITSATEFELSAATTGGSVTNGTLTFGYEAYTPNKAHKVYICNSSTSETDFVVITINDEEIGRLYAGDWMFMPWGATDASADIFVTAATQTSPVILDYMVIGEGNAA